MTAVTVVAPLLVMFLACGLVVQRWSARLWVTLVLATLLILVVNIAVVFR